MKAQLIDSRAVAPGVAHFEFEVPEVESLHFIPGQFASLVHDFEGKEITRAYSIASAPAGNRFALCLNLVEDGRFSPFLFAMKPGDTVELKGILGTFTVRNPDRDMIWVATGTGIAPFRGMWLGRQGSGKVTLVFGVRYESHLLYREEWESAPLDFRPTLSRPTPTWSGRTGHVQPHVMEALGERRDVDIYICGLKAMVDDIRAQLKQAGVDRKQIIYEKYD